MEQYDVTGMSCAACSARVEKAVSHLDGVENCAVNLLTNSMTVEGSATPEEVIAAVVEAGYGANVKGEGGSSAKGSQANDDAGATAASKKLKMRLISSVVLLVILMYFSMGVTMWNFPVPKFFNDYPLATALSQLIISALIMVINQKFFINGFKGIIHRAPNMDTLVSLGSVSAFVYSTVMTFVMIPLHGHEAHMFLHELYFESAAMVLTLITVGKLLEAKAKGKTTNALKALMNLAPQTATVIKNGVATVVPVEKVRIGDVFAVKPGESIPVDGRVVKGESTVDESALTGESLPIDKEIGSDVSSGTINQSGYIECEAVRVGEDTTLSQIIKVVNDASASKAPIAKIADKVAGVFVPVVISIALVTLVVWLLLGKEFGFALARSISVLVISCPCALGLATPVAIMVGSGVGAKNGILFKTATALEVTGKIKTVALDKTGTITLGQMRVTDVITNDNVKKNDLLSAAIALEERSEHPLGKAVVLYGKENNIISKQVEGFKALSGNGVTATMGASTLWGGNKKFISDKAEIPQELLNKAEALAESGKTPLFFAQDNELLGVIGVADIIKEDSPEAINELKELGIKTVMITGDNQKTADAIGKLSGVDKVYAGVMPTEKEKIIQELQKDGRVIMVGDGINDAPALTRADVGIAIGNGTDVAISSADVVIMKNNLSDVVSAIRLSKGVIRNIHENLLWAFGYNIIGIPLAAGCFISLLGWEMNPMFGAAAMSLSSFLVVSNALRLNFIKIKSKKALAKEKAQAEALKENSVKNASENTDKDIKPEKEIKTMKQTIKIEGMMCPHCEARVKKALEALPEVQEAVADHEKNAAFVTVTSALDTDKIKGIIEDNGYTFLGIEG